MKIYKLVVITTTPDHDQFTDTFLYSTEDLAEAGEKYKIEEHAYMVSTGYSFEYAIVEGSLDNHLPDELLHQQKYIGKDKRINDLETLVKALWADCTSMIQDIKGKSITYNEVMGVLDCMMDDIKEIAWRKE